MTAIILAVGVLIVGIGATFVGCALAAEQRKLTDTFDTNGSGQ